MNPLKSYRAFGIIVCLLVPSLVGFTSIPQSQKDSRGMEISLEFPPTGDRGAPKKTAGGGTRSDDVACLNVKEGDLSLVALMPNRKNMAKTATSTPTIYIYVPENKVKTAEFVLVDENNQEIYETILTLPDKAGIISFTIPEKAGLTPGKNYSWSFMVICDSNYRNRDKFVGGTINCQKLTPELQNQLKNADNLKKAQLYANSEIWYEALDLIAQMRSKHPQEWQQLLQSVGLGEVEQFPLLDVQKANLNQ